MGVRAEESGTLQYMLDMIKETQKGDFYFREIDMSGSAVKIHHQDASGEMQRIAAEKSCGGRKSAEGRE